MRVLLDVSAVPAQPVGVGVFTLALATGLDARDDIRLHLLARRGDDERWTTTTPNAVVHADAPPQRPARLAWEQVAGPRLARAVKADVWHGPHYTLPLRVGLPTVVTVHDMTFFTHPEWHERAKVVYFRQMIRAVARRADVLVCDSEFTAEQLDGIADPNGEVLVVPLGIDHDRFARATADRETDLAALAAHGITPPYVGFASTIEPRKNVPALVKAFARVAEHHPDVRLVLAGGDGWGVDELRVAIAASGIATRVVRPGYLPDATIAALFRQAEVVAYPSLEEGFGLPALEALASGSPLVTSHGSALEEVVGDAALLVPPGDVDALADALQRVLDDPELARTLAAAGPVRAAPFTWERTVAGHVDAYRLATSQHAAA